ALFPGVAGRGFDKRTRCHRVPSSPLEFLVLALRLLVVYSLFVSFFCMPALFLRLLVLVLRKQFGKSFRKLTGVVLAHPIFAYPMECSFQIAELSLQLGLERGFEYTSHFFSGRKTTFQQMSSHKNGYRSRFQNSQLLGSFIQIHCPHRNVSRKRGSSSHITLYKS